MRGERRPRCERRLRLSRRRTRVPWVFEVYHAPGGDAGPAAQPVIGPDEAADGGPIAAAGATIGLDERWAGQPGGLAAPDGNGSGPATG